VIVAYQGGRLVKFERAILTYQPVGFAGFRKTIPVARIIPAFNDFISG